MVEGREGEVDAGLDGDLLHLGDLDGDLLLLFGLAGLGDGGAVQDEEGAGGRSQSGLEHPGRDEQPGFDE